MLKQHSFSNPFSGIKEKFQKSGRSNSAPGAYDIYIDRFWSLCVCVCVCVCPTNQTHFVIGRPREHMFSSCFSDILCLFGFCIFCLPLQIAWLFFAFCKRPGPMNGRKHLCKAWHNIYMCVCLFLYSLFACLQIACLLLSFCKRPMGENIFAMLHITFSAPFHKNNAFPTQYNTCMKYHL